MLRKPLEWNWSPSLCGTLWALSGHGYVSLKPRAGSCLLKSYHRLYNSRSREGGGGLVQPRLEQAGLYNLKGQFWKHLRFSTSEACYISFFNCSKLSGRNKLPFKLPGPPNRPLFMFTETPEFVSLGTPGVWHHVLKMSFCFSSHGVYRYVRSHCPAVTM